MIFRKKKSKKTMPKKKPATTHVKQPVQKSSIPSKHPILPKPDILPEDKKSTPKKEEKKADARKEFLKTFKQLTYRHRAWDIWRDFITMFACSISNSLDKSHFDEREKRYLKIIKKYNKEEQNLFPELAAHTVMALEENPEQDFLGGIFMELGLSNSSNGQFFTPYHICDLMAKITVNDISKEIDEKGYITIHDPCCGAGATLIAGVHEARRQLEKMNLNYWNHILVVAQDIDMTVALMCYIQLSLLGVAGFIKVGDTFTEPICDGESTENYWFTPMYFSDVWKMRRLFHEMDELMKGENDANSQAKI